MIESTKKLKEAQAKEDSPEAKATLPTLSVADLDREVKRIPIEVSEVQGVEVVKHDVPSSGEQSVFLPSLFSFTLLGLSNFNFYIEFCIKSVKAPLFFKVQCGRKLYSTIFNNHSAQRKT